MAFVEQISTRIVGTTERVWMTSPQAQVITQSAYSGWIPFFISTSPIFDARHCRLTTRQAL